MDKNYKLIFDNFIIKQLKKAAKNNQVKSILTKMLDKLELIGPLAGKLLDTKLHIYETKNMSPPIRLYFKYLENCKEIYVFEYQMKTSKETQNDAIDEIKKKSKELES